MLKVESKAKQTIVVVQKWEEREPGWGCRPDGYSLHLNEDDRKKYVEAHTTLMIKHGYLHPDGSQKLECDFPDGKPYAAEVSPEIFQKIVNAAKYHGYRVQKHQDKTYPGNGGTDGWKNRK